MGEPYVTCRNDPRTTSERAIERDVDTSIIRRALVERGDTVFSDDTGVFVVHDRE
jgi:regulator of RNase E activity RraA